MKHLKLILALAAIASCCSLYSCGWDPFDKCGGDYNFLAENTFYFEILNKKTKENVLLIGQIDYNYDTVNIYRDNWTTLPPPWNTPYDGVLYLNFIDRNDVGVVDQYISKKFFMYFNYQDIDTIDITFETAYDKCHLQKLKYFKIAYNDSVYFDGATTSGNQRPPYAYLFKKY